MEIDHGEGSPSPPPPKPPDIHIVSPKLVKQNIFKNNENIVSLNNQDENSTNFSQTIGNINSDKVSQTNSLIPNPLNGAAIKNDINTNNISNQKLHTYYKSTDLGPLQVYIENNCTDFRGKIMMDPDSFKKTKRKIRCTHEFNQLHRESLAITPSKSSASEKKVSKKNNAFFYLPKVDMDFGCKENSSPNISEKKLSKRKRQNESSKGLLQNICNSDIKETWNERSNETSVDGERKDSTEILFKKRRKKKKQLSFKEQSKAGSNEDLSNIKMGISIIDKTIKQSVSQNDTEQNLDSNDNITKMQNFDPIDHVKVRKSKSILNTFNKHPSRKSTIKTSSKSLSDLAPSPIGSEEISDDVFSDSFKLSETVECNNELFPSENNSNKSNTFELQSSIFDVSQLPVIQSIKKDLGNCENNGNKRLKSLNTRKSVNNIKIEKCMRSKSSSGNSSKMNKASLSNVSYSSRKSVRFTDCKNDNDFSILEQNNSIKYRKSPYISNFSKNRSKNEQHLFDISPNGTSTNFNETYEMISPTKSESKITKRKKWNRSLGASILDSTGLIHTVSPPWEIEESNNSFNFSYGSNSSLAMNLFDLNCQIIHSPQKETANCSTPIKIASTEENRNSLGKNPSIIVHSLKQSKSTGTLKWADSPIGKASCSKKTIQTDNKANYGSSNKKVKVPNFALIHQKAYDKLENLKDMTERKALRTKLLLSGRKPNIENLEVKSPRFKIKSPKSKKLLRFIPKRKSLDKLKEQQASSSSNTGTKDEVAPSTSNPKVITDKSLKNKIKSNIPKLTKKPIEDQKKGLTKLSLKSVTDEKKSKQGEIKAVVNKTKVVKNSIETRRNAVQDQIKAVANKTKGVRNSIETRRNAVQDQIKAVANKTKGVRNSIETRRNAVQHVRSNRRFELLMKMRKGKH
ncbi:unnamed protein product [Psylliodes chrysocephalus]|uniref:Uncharacterized protein n=1 Tax=Psylliodes chrysocephalus TaxID=3402493 RepID=A0A9P0G756_9CUCU|nr:unnamed protein product [Psylliodes chrysocephala]